MSPNTSDTHGETRSSALWGSGNRGGDSRANALWGKGGRGFVALMLVLVAVSVPLAGAAKEQKAANGALPATYIDPYLLAKARLAPNALVPVIIQSAQSMGDASEAFETADDQDGTKDRESEGRKFKFMSSIAVTLKAHKVLFLEHHPGLIVTHDAKIKLDSTPSSKQVWPTAENIRPFYGDTDKYRSQTPTIAIVDSGIDKNRADFDLGARVIKEVDAELTG